MTAACAAAGSHRVDFDAIPWESPIEGMRCKTRLHRGRRLRLVEYTPRMAPHWCDQGHVGYLLAGRLQVTFADQTVVYEAGDGVLIPSGRAHRHLGRALTEVVRVVFVEDVE